MYCPNTKNQHSSLRLQQSPWSAPLVIRPYGTFVMNNQFLQLLSSKNKSHRLVKLL